MINVSNEFRALMGERTDFICHAAVTLADGTELTWGLEDFTLAGNTLTDGAGADGFPLGAAICRTAQLQIVNDDGHLDDLDFFGATIRLYLDFRLSETTERVAMGTFTVTEPETAGQTVTITAGDAMYKADRSYEPSIAFPATLGEMFRDICDRCGIPYSTAAFRGSTFQVTAAPAEGYTCRQVLGYIAMIAGGNARISRDGRMEILSYDMGREPDHDLVDWVTLKTDTDDILVTGLETAVIDEDGAETTVMEGAEGYVLTVENPLMAGKEAQALALMGQGVLGAAFRKFEGEHIAYPLAEFMDTVRLTDRKGNTYMSVITDVEFAFGGRTSMSNSAASAVRNGSRYISPEVKAKIAARELVAQEKTAREAAVARLNERLAESAGMYSTQKVLPDSSTVYYLHDKPTVGESQNVMKLTAEAIGFSTDGGKTYPFGFTVTGEMIMGIIRSEGISADWINAGALTVQDEKGNVIFLADVEGHRFLVDTENFKVDADGVITAKNGNFSGDIKAESFAILDMSIGKERVTSWEAPTYTDENGSVNFSGGHTNESFGQYGLAIDPGVSFKVEGKIASDVIWADSGIITDLKSSDIEAGTIRAHELSENGTKLSSKFFRKGPTGTVPSGVETGDIVPLGNGGTGATTAAEARTNLGAFASANIESGLVNVACAPNTVCSAEVKFSKAFSNAPRVVAQVFGSSAAWVQAGIGVTEVSTTGFKVNALISGTGTVQIYWIAARAA